MVPHTQNKLISIMVTIPINNDPSIRHAALTIAAGATTTETLPLSIKTAGSFDNKPYCLRLIEAPQLTGTLTLLAGSDQGDLIDVTKDGSPIEITPGEVLDPITSWGLPYIALKASEAQAEERTIHVIIAQL